MPLLELAHVEADHEVLAPEERLRERPGELGLADAGRAEEEEAPHRPVGVAEAGARAADRLRDRAHRLVLADDAAVELLLEGEQALPLFRRQLRHRDPGRARHDLGDVVGRDLRGPLPPLAALVELAAARVQLIPELAGAVVVLG